NKVAELGFERECTTWWKRRYGAVVQGVHLHKFSFTTSSRVPFGDSPGRLRCIPCSLAKWHEQSRWVVRGNSPKRPFRPSNPLAFGARGYSFKYTEVGLSGDTAKQILDCTLTRRLFNRVPQIA